MTKVTKQEIIHLSRISFIGLKDNQIDPLLIQMQDVLSYAARVSQVAVDVPTVSCALHNIFRSDIAEQKNPELVLSCAPNRMENFFVVPMILEQV